MLRTLLLCCVLFGLTNSLPAIGTIISATQKVVDKATQMYDSLAKDNTITPTDVAVAVFEGIPVIGDIVSLLTGGNRELQDKITQINNELKNLANLQQQTLNLLESLQRKIDLLVLKNQVATASKGITSCFTDLQHFVNSPETSAEKDRLLHCFDVIMPDVRQMARLLKEEEFTLEATKLFQYIINAENGNCDGLKIMNTYKFLFGLFVSGCEVAIASETLKYNGQSVTLQSECKKISKEIETHMYAVYQTCTKETCERQFKVVSKTVEQNQFDHYIKYVREELSHFMPWYKFSLFKLTANPNIDLKGNFLPSVVLLTNGQLYYIVLWTPYETQAVISSPMKVFYLEFDTKALYSDASDMNIIKEVSGNRTMVVSYFAQSKITFTYTPCKSTTTKVISGASPVYCRFIDLLLHTLLLSYISVLYTQ